MNMLTTETKQQGIYISYRTLNFKGLKIFDKLVYSTLEDRMKSSIKSMNFYNFDRYDHYVIYEQIKLAEFLGVHPNTVYNSLLKLEDLGYIQRVAQKHSADEIFLPFSPLTKFVGIYSQNLCTNHFTQSFSKCTFGTSVTVNGIYGNKNVLNNNDSENNKNDQEHSKNSNSTKQRKFKIERRENNEITVSEDDLYKKEYDSLQSCGISWELAYTFDKFTNSIEDMYRKVGILFQTKKSAIKKCIKDGNEEAITMLNFEENRDLNEMVRQTLFSAMTSIHSSKKIKKPESFLAKCFYNLFDFIIENQLSSDVVNRDYEDNKNIDSNNKNRENSGQDPYVITAIDKFRKQISEHKKGQGNSDFHIPIIKLDR
ncbi:hypothetical protein DY120_07385 [Apilactobacillus micheneri]|uniref:Replication initiator protein A C-terminal domain-containing protein n=1 Tax=Apilactobacillus micheneri TaxID=1899430 RepID=A0ABY2YZP0_9LACO|nr:hypothetical protein [Apilactobacillus micheneri]TPR23120.1 hypothetical protein DY114_07370 [Apilactobacillus micheneri]TPR24438.1 hypothetical protein DY111_07385 [Apilactobacillus micheneri]TPR29385.1 hypothetical protein DY120_07385 [Apilactobacillus micheneri]TPR34592.1 hypothetical protein DY027_07375 [Apilactobacillus micheneri]